MMILKGLKKFAKAKYPNCTFFLFRYADILLLSLKPAILIV